MNEPHRSDELLIHMLAQCAPPDAVLRRLRARIAEAAADLPTADPRQLVSDIFHQAFRGLPDGRAFGFR